MTSSGRFTLTSAVILLAWSLGGCNGSQPSQQRDSTPAAAPAPVQAVPTAPAPVKAVTTAPAPPAPPGWVLVRKTASYDRASLATPDMEARVKAAGVIAGYTGKDWNPVSGWFEYEVEVPGTGWYEYLTPVDMWGMEYFVDGKLLAAHGGRKLDNLWLTAGKHVFRIQRWSWTGFDPKFDAWTLRTSTPEPGRTLRLTLGDGRTMVRAGETARLVIQCGGRSSPLKVSAQLVASAGGAVASSCEVELPAGPGDAAVPAPLPCPKEGIYNIAISVAGAQVPPAELPAPEIVVLDTGAPVRGGEVRKTLLSEIDCVATAPAFAGRGGSTVVDGAPGRYRQGGDGGFLHAQHHGQDAGWFAYTFSVPEAQQPYILETDCPDDEFRTFTIMIREAAAGAYPVAGGMDTGGSFRLSRTMQTHALLFWPMTTDLRAVFLTAHNGRPGAAAAKIRVYRVEGGLPVMDVPARGNRTFANWYEEGSNYIGIYGARADLPGSLIGSERWARTIASMGGDLLMPTMAVYQMGMYPSEYNTAFCSSATFDAIRLLLMRAEKYGLGLAGEFHPECRELDRLGAPETTGRAVNRLTSKDGHTRVTFDETPRFHPLDPVDQAWYLGMVGEFCERYKDSPAFRGVSLRLMGWANPGLNNFHSLDWGYDDLTVGLFEKETGLSTGAKADDPKRFQARHAWLMANAKERWIAWRCQQIAGIYTRIRDRVRQSRADLLVYSTVFDLGIEAGIDPRLLGAIDGVLLINSRHAYGRQAFTYEGPMADHLMRDKLLDPSELASMATPAGAAFLFGHRYFEATERVVTPEALGFPKTTKATWSSGVVNPAGRLFLERYATALAETDAVFLADGGNTYTVGQPVLREFMAEFRRLPAVRFRSRPDAVDPLTVRELPRATDHLFYVLNRERFPLRAELRLQTSGAVKRLATGEEARLADGVLRLDLQPYQLLAFQAPAGSAITGVTATIPEAERAAVEAQVAAVRRMAETTSPYLDDEGRRLLAAAAAESQRCLAAGHVWRARTLLENSRLAVKVYNRTLEFPPGLEFLADPGQVKAIRARNTARAADALVALPLDGLQDGRTPVAGRLAGLQAVCEGGCVLAEGRNGGKSLRLDGKSGRVVLQGEAAAKLDLKDFTLSLWINADSLAERTGLVSRQTYPAGFSLFFWNGSLASEAGSASGCTAGRTGDNLFKAGVWYHLAVTCASGKELAIHVDGSRVAQVALPQTAQAPAAPFLLGWNGWGGRQNDQTPGWFAGRIADVRVFDRVLSEEELLGEWAGRERTP